MAAGTIWTELNLDNTKFKIGMQKSVSDSRTASKKIESDMKAMTDKVQSYLGGMAGRIGAAFGTYKLAGLAKDAALLAARYETLGVSLSVVGRNMGSSGAALEAYAQKIQAAGISMIESRQNILRMAQANLDLTKSIDLASAAQGAAVIADMNSSEAFETMVHGIASAQVKVLRNIGIMVEFDEEYKKAAHAVGKTTESLTANEKVQIRLNAVLEKSKVMTGLYEAAMGTASKQLHSTKRYVENLEVSLGSVFSEALYAAVFAFNDGLKNANKEVDKLADGGDLKRWGRDMIQTFAYIATAIQPVVKLFQTLGAAIGGVGASAVSVYDMGKALASGDLAGARKAYAGLRGVDDADNDRMKEIWGNWTDYTAKANEFFAARDKSDAAMKNMMNQTGVDVRPKSFEGDDAVKEKAQKAAGQIAEIMARINAKTLESNVGLDKHLEAIAKINNEYNEYIKKLKEAGANNAQMTLGSAAADHLRQIQLQNLELEKQRELYKDMLDASEQRADFENDIMQRMIEAGKSGDEIQQALEYLEKFQNKTEKGYAKDKLLGGLQNKSGSSLVDFLEIASGAVGSIGNAKMSDRGGYWAGFGKLAGGLGKLADGKKLEGTLGKIAPLFSAISAMSDAYAAGGAQGNRTMGAATGAVAGAATGAATGAAMTSATGPGAIIGAIVGAIAGGVMGFLGGGGSSKKPPTNEEMEAGKIYSEQKQLQYRGFMAPVVPKSFIESHIDAMREYTERLKSLDKQISETMGKSLSEALKQPTMQAAIDEFNETFSASFSNMFISEATSSMQKMAKTIMAPLFQVMNDLTFMLENKFYEAIKPLYKGLTEIYKDVANIVGGAFDALNNGLKVITKFMPVVGNGLAIAIYGSLLAMIPSLYSALAEVFGAVGKFLEKMFQPMVEQLSTMVRRFENMFDIQPDWIKELSNAGIKLENWMGKDFVGKLQETWGTIKGVIEESLTAAMKSGNADSAWETFSYKMKNGMYKAMIEAAIKAVAAGGIILGAMAPYIKDFVQLITAAAQGKGFDIDKFGAILTGIMGNFESLLADSEGILKKLFNMGLAGYNAANKIDGSFASGINYVPYDMTARIHKGERVVTAEENRRGLQGGVNVTVNVGHIKETVDLDDLAYRLGYKIEQQLRFA